LPGRPAARFLDYDGSTILTSWAISRSALPRSCTKRKVGEAKEKLVRVFKLGYKIPKAMQQINNVTKCHKMQYGF